MQNLDTSIDKVNSSIQELDSTKINNINLQQGDFEYIKKIKTEHIDFDLKKINTDDHEIELKKVLTQDINTDLNKNNNQSPNDQNLIDMNTNSNNKNSKQSIANNTYQNENNIDHIKLKKIVTDEK